MKVRSRKWTIGIERILKTTPVLGKWDGDHFIKQLTPSSTPAFLIGVPILAKAVSFSNMFQNKSLFVSLRLLNTDLDECISYFLMSYKLFSVLYVRFRFKKVNVHFIIIEAKHNFRLPIYKINYRKK